MSHDDNQLMSLYAEFTVSLSQLSLHKIRKVPVSV